MHFWESICDSSNMQIGPNIISQIRTTDPQRSRISPTGSPVRQVLTHTEAVAVQEFLRRHFGNPPHSPILLPDIDITDPSQSILLYVHDTNGIVGTLRYSYSGNIDSHPIYGIDCFCIHPLWRKRGVGSYLLSELHTITMARGMKYSLFLKESAPVIALQRPIYSSSYVYLQNNSICIMSHTIISLSSSIAHRLVNIYKSIYPSTFTLLHKGDKKIHWRFWRNPVTSNFILASFQDSYQIHPETGTSIGWCSGWLESYSEISPILRSNVILEMMATIPYEWIWADKQWIRPLHESPWKHDGVFHWYTYQWKPVHCPDGKSYILQI